MKLSKNFIEYSLVGILSFLKSVLFAEEHALKPGFVQSLDPRIKTVTFLLFVIAALLAKSVLVVLFLYFLCLFLAGISKINFGFFLKRTLVFIPLFSLFIAFPALFNKSFVVTRAGLESVLLFVSRVSVSVSFVVLLSITTRHFELLKVLRIFGIPQAFTMVLGMCYRYIYLFLEIVENTYFAVKSRVGTVLHYKSGQTLVAWNVVFLWQRSYQLNEEVYHAMLSRGYRGEPVILNNFRSKPKDWLWLFVVVVVIVIVIM